MPHFEYKTIGNADPKGKPRIYFVCYPDDFAKYFEEYSAKLFKIQDCAVWYDSSFGEDWDEDDLKLQLSRMQLFVVPVTADLLTKPNRAMYFDIPLAFELHIPVLPLMMETGLDAAYSKRFGNLQYLDPNADDPTKLSFDDVLSKYIHSVIISDELAEKVRDAFDAYIFLSYRKKDRAAAQKLMEMIHRNPACRDIAIWYDEFLIPGEDFNLSISEMLKKSSIFALTVTPNLVNESNYVRDIEYPAALADNKPVFAVEMVQTDRRALFDSYSGLTECVNIYDEIRFQEILDGLLKRLAIPQPDDTPEHKYLIALAYLDGIDLEKDPWRAEKLLEEAAEAGLPEAAGQLSMMFENGKGVERVRVWGARWKAKQAELLRKRFERNPSEDNGNELMEVLTAQGKQLIEISKLDEAEAVLRELSEISARTKWNLSDTAQVRLAWSYYQLAKIKNEKDDTGEAVKLLEEAVKIVKASKTASGKMHIALYIYLSGVLIKREEIDAAEKYVNMLLPMAQDEVRKKDDASSNSDLSSAYSLKGDIEKARRNYDLAADCYRQSLSIFEKISGGPDTAVSKNKKARIYRDLGEVREFQEDHVKARDLYKTACGLYREAYDEDNSRSNEHALYRAYVDLAYEYLRLKDYKNAQENFEKALPLNMAIAMDVKEDDTFQKLHNLAELTFRLAEMNGDGPVMQDARYTQLRVSIGQWGLAETDDAWAKMEADYDNLYKACKYNNCEKDARFLFGDAFMDNAVSYECRNELVRASKDYKNAYYEFEKALKETGEGWSDQKLKVMKKLAINAYRAGSREGLPLDVRRDFLHRSIGFSRELLDNTGDGTYRAFISGSEDALRELEEES
ncbi:MAG: tetratricopeptide repeat protein [Lachnospiraceae bacterium]|nr:tetratricopeptide repeat protein [Lachnospiraceae bacterium]